MRLNFRFVAPLVLAASVVTCSDSPLGPGAGVPGRARLAFEPRFSSAALSALQLLSSAGLVVDRVRIVVVRPPSDTLKDTTVVFPVGVDALPLELTVTAVPGEQLGAGLQYQSGSTVLFSGTTSVVVRVSGAPGPTPPPTVEIVYVGPDKAATLLLITPAAGAFTTTDPVQFTAQTLDGAGAVVPNVPIVWSTSDAGIATISPTGLLQFTGTDGAVIVTAQTPKGLSATGALTFTLKGPPAVITILPGTPTLTALGDLLALAATVKDQRGTVLTTTSTWVSRAPAIVSVTSDGTVQAKANGDAYIVASAGAAKDSVLVLVSQVPDVLIMSRDTVKLALLDTTTLSATVLDHNRNVIVSPALSFTSDSLGIATVTSGGLVTLLAAGPTTVVATAGTKTATTVVMQGTAGVPISAGFAYIRITPGSGSIRMGSPTQLAAEYVDAKGVPTAITPQWASTQPGRAPISSAGLLSPVDTTTVDITATSNGIAGHASFTVLPAPAVTRFSFAPATVGGVSLAIGMLSVTVGAADPGSGIKSMETVFTGPGGVSRSCTATVPTIGPVTRGTWDCVLVLPILSPTGIWHATRLTLVGTITRSFDETQLSAFGATTLTVTP
jgi:hypothetical protein